MQLCYRGIRYNPKSTSSSSSAFSPSLKYRGVSYSHQNSEISKAPYHKKLTYRGISYDQDSSQPVQEVKTIPTLKSAFI